MVSVGLLSQVNIGVKFDLVSSQGHVVGVTPRLVLPHTTLTPRDKQETEEVAGRVKVGEGSIRKIGKQGEVAIKPKPVEVRNTQEKETENTFNILQEEDTEPLQEEEESL